MQGLTKYPPFTPTNVLRSPRSSIQFTQVEASTPTLATGTWMKAFAVCGMQRSQSGACGGRAKEESQSYHPGRLRATTLVQHEALGRIRLIVGQNFVRAEISDGELGAIVDGGDLVGEHVLRGNGQSVPGRTPTRGQTKAAHWVFLNLTRVQSEAEAVPAVVTTPLLASTRFWTLPRLSPFVQATSTRRTQRRCIFGGSVCLINTVF